MKNSDTRESDFEHLYVFYSLTQENPVDREIAKKFFFSGYAAGQHSLMKVVAKGIQRIKEKKQKDTI